MIRIRQLQFSYPDGQFSLQIPELDLQPHRSAVIVGPSGSGKTTLLNLVAGILPIHQGQVTVAETAVHLLNDADRRLFRLRNIGMVFQDFQLIEYLSVLENVMLPCRIHPSVSLTNELRQRGVSLLESTGLAPLQHRSVTRLSQGERQRVAICRALLLSPRIVLADEPTGNLDPINSERIVKLLLSETARSEATLVMVTHDHSLLPHFDRVIPFEPFLHPTAI
jgi:putative ABC transport system ATP-binding protein